MNDKRLVLASVSVSFGDIHVLNNVSLEVEHDEFVAIAGQSGCGKSTLLNVMSGHVPYSGKVSRGGRIRMVFQQDGLFPWRTVAQNIELGVRDVADRKKRMNQVGAALELVGLSKFAHLYPHELSGGMRQRVELARAFVGDSDILLLDEPFSALDYLTRVRMRDELMRLLREWPRTVVLVTHDIDEAVQLSDRVLVLSNQPAQVQAEMRSRIPRPRDPAHPEVIATVKRILFELGVRSPEEGTQAAGLVEAV